MDIWIDSLTYTTRLLVKMGSVPLHFKEALTFHFPIILPLLGVKLCLIYVAAFWPAAF